MLLFYLTTCRPSFPVEGPGYLYFKPPEPHRPAFSGEIRFRPATTPEMFATGKDLAKPDGEPWGLPLFTLINTGFRPLYERLVEDGLVTQDVQQLLTSFSSSAKFRSFILGHRRSGSPPVLRSLSDPFTINLSAGEFSLFALTNTGFTHTMWPQPFRDDQNNWPRLVYKGIFPNQPVGMVLDHSPGTLRLQFERSNLPQHAGTRTVVIRVLSEVHPVECVHPDYDGWVRKPQVGELVLTPGMHGPAPLSINLDPSYLVPSRETGLINLLRLLWQSDTPYEHASIGDTVTAKPLAPPYGRVRTPSPPTCLLYSLVFYRKSSPQGGRGQYKRWIQQGSKQLARHQLISQVHQACILQAPVSVRE